MPAREIVANELARFLSAISHPHRVQIIELLRDDEKDVNTLEEELQISHSSVSQHLSKLRAYRLVKMHREGRHVFYSLANPDLALWLLEGLKFTGLELERSQELHSALEDLQQILKERKNST